ncbi:hypothetical protein ACHAWT_008434 [Skeletonema menzelii]
MTSRVRQTCLLQLYTKKSSLLFFFAILLMIVNYSFVAATSNESSLRLRGHSNQAQEIDEIASRRPIIIEPTKQKHRAVKAEDNDSILLPSSSTTILLTQSPTFQIVTSSLLSLLILLQLLLLLSFIRQRTRRVLEFAQPNVICIFLACSIIATSACYLYVYISNPSCAIREPIVFLSVSLMGATVGGRAWRISTLWNNPLLAAGRSRGNGSSSSSVSRVEQLRQWTLRLLSVLAGCQCHVMVSKKHRNTSSNSSSGGGGGGRPIRVQITFIQMMRATVVMILPQLLWQTVLVSAPMLRSSRELLSYTYNYNDGDNQMVVVTMEQYQCQQPIGFWPNYVSILLTLLPFAIAYLFNVRSKAELDQLPEIIDEREHLKQSFRVFATVLVVALPMIGLTFKNNPAAKGYGAICAVLGLPLACCYHIAYVKLYSTKSNVIYKQQQSRRATAGTASSLLGAGDDADGRSSAAVAVRMAEMYSRIGRVEETVQLVNETLGVFRKGNNGNLGNLGLHNDGRQEVASGFTLNDLKALEGDELQMIIQLLRLQGNALIKLEGPAGFAMSAKLNIDALKIFENCPAADQMKDISLIFPIYNMVGIQLKGGVIDQDDECSLEMELAQRFCHEAQLQAYHYARSLANLAEMYGRVGWVDKAFKYFNIMKAVYMKQEHPKLLLDAYAVDRCAVAFASSALWYLRKGKIDNAIEACDYVIDHILPHYDEKDIIGLYHIFVQMIRVLKWNGHVDKARDAYNKFIPDAANSHFAVGSIHKPMGLLLRICEGSSSHQYDMDNMPADIELALSFDMSDMTDHNFTADGWSMKSMAAEVCMLLARRLDAGNAARERLIDRGIMMATVAQQRVKASNGMVKHVLAYEANRDIHKALLLLANEEVGIDRNVIYDMSSNGVGRSPSNLRESMTSEFSKSKSKATLAFANRFNVKDESPKTNGSATISNGSDSTSAVSSKPPFTAIASKKKVNFSHLSSFGSNGSEPLPSSRHSHDSESVIENSSNHSRQKNNGNAGAADAVK